MDSNSIQLNLNAKYTPIKLDGNNFATRKSNNNWKFAVSGLKGVSAFSCDNKTFPNVLDLDDSLADFEHGMLKKCTTPFKPELVLEHPPDSLPCGLHNIRAPESWLSVYPNRLVFSSSTAFKELSINDVLPYALQNEYLTPYFDNNVATYCSKTALCVFVSAMLPRLDFKASSSSLMHHVDQAMLVPFIISLEIPFSDTNFGIKELHVEPFFKTDTGNAQNISSMVILEKLGNVQLIVATSNGMLYAITVTSNLKFEAEKRIVYKTSTSTDDSEAAISKLYKMDQYDCLVGVTFDGTLMLFKTENFKVASLAHVAVDNSAIICVESNLIAVVNGEMMQLFQARPLKESFSLQLILSVNLMGRRWTGVQILIQNEQPLSGWVFALSQFCDELYAISFSVRGI